MGCDIAIVGEVRVNRRWREFSLDFEDGYRDYDAFAILGNVRNGAHGRSWKPIGCNRGLPPGTFLPPVPRSYEGSEHPLGFDVYGVSWVGLDELLAYPWDEPVSAVGGSEYNLVGPTPREAAPFLSEVLVPQMEAVCRRYRVYPADVRIIFSFSG